MAKEILEKISADEKVRQEYYTREKARLDAISKLKYAEAKGMAKGMEEGIEKARAEVAIKAIRKGFDVEDIIELTGLDREEIEKLKKKLEQIEKL